MVNTDSNYSELGKHTQTTNKTSHPQFTSNMPIRASSQPAFLLPTVLISRQRRRGHLPQSHTEILSDTGAPASLQVTSTSLQQYAVPTPISQSPSAHTAFCNSSVTLPQVLSEGHSIYFLDQFWASHPPPLRDSHFPSAAQAKRPFLQ